MNSPSRSRTNSIFFFPLFLSQGLIHIINVVRWKSIPPSKRSGPRKPFEPAAPWSAAPWVKRCYDTLMIKAEVSVSEKADYISK